MPVAIDLCINDNSRSVILYMYISIHEYIPRTRSGQTINLSMPTDNQDRTPQLAPHILILHIMRVLDLSPHARLPSHFQTRRLGRLLNPKPLLLTTTLLQLPEFLAPLDQQPRAHKQTLARKHRALQRRKLKRRQPRDPPPDDAARDFRLAEWHYAVFVEDGLQLDARPDGGGEEADDWGGRADLDVAQRRSACVVHLGLHGGVRRLRRCPAQQRVRVQVPHHDRDDLVACCHVAPRFCFHHVLRPRDHRGHGDVVVLQRLLRRFQQVPFDRDRVRKVWFGFRDRDDRLIRRPHGAPVQEDLVPLRDFLDVHILPEAAFERAGLARCILGGAELFALLQELRFPFALFYPVAIL